MSVADVLEVPFFAVVVSRSASDGYSEKGTKNRKSRRVPLMGRAAEIVRSHIEGKALHERVFTSPRGCRLNGGNFKRALAWETTAAGYRVHDLRHTAATSWLQSGVDVKTVSEWLGHSGTALTLRVYVHHMGSDSDLAAIRRVETATAAQSITPVVRLSKRKAR